MNIIVVYRSKYGSTKQYAQWLAEELGADLSDAEDVFDEQENLSRYDSIVYCGGLYAGGILGFKKFQRQCFSMRDKKLFVVAVGATTRRDEQCIMQLKNKNLLMPLKENVEFFLLRGALNYQKMNCIDRCAMFLLVSFLKLKDRKKLDRDALGIINTYGKNTDFLDKKSIKPIVDALRKFQKDIPCI